MLITAAAAEEEEEEEEEKVSHRPRSVAWEHIYFVNCDALSRRRGLNAIKLAYDPTSAGRPASFTASAFN